ncbi:hypothetical protein BgiMline_005982 [Biomphalaria glabrata]|nr:hypothetical protein BgiMline_003959 [Biomphalaria glabrata]
MFSPGPMVYVGHQLMVYVGHQLMVYVGHQLMVYVGHQLIKPWSMLDINSSNHDLCVGHQLIKPWSMLDINSSNHGLCWTSTHQTLVYVGHQLIKPWSMCWTSTHQTMVYVLDINSSNTNSKRKDEVCEFHLDSARAVVCYTHFMRSCHTSRLHSSRTNFKDMHLKTKQTPVTACGNKRISQGNGDWSTVLHRLTLANQ